ncbi:MAG TPA: hypothetical protein VIK89_11145, partial [Cytophagaceae bacterium]
LRFGYGRYRKRPVKCIKQLSFPLPNRILKKLPIGIMNGSQDLENVSPSTYGKSQLYQAEPKGNSHTV